VFCLPFARRRAGPEDTKRDSERSLEGRRSLVRDIWDQGAFFKMRRLLLALGLVATVLPFGAGCDTTEPVLWSRHHWKRKGLTIMEGFHRFHMDFDRIIFDMEEYPVEPEY